MSVKNLFVGLPAVNYPRVFLDTVYSVCVCVCVCVCLCVCVCVCTCVWVCVCVHRFDLFDDCVLACQFDCLPNLDACWSSKLLLACFLSC